MGKKNSMYISGYQVMGFSTNTKVEESKQNYINYIQSLIDELIDLKIYAKSINTRTSIKTFYEYQTMLIQFKNKLNAKTLAEWHNDFTYELEKEVEKLRTKPK